MERPRGVAYLAKLLLGSGLVGLVVLPLYMIMQRGYLGADFEFRLTRSQKALEVGMLLLDVIDVAVGLGLWMLRNWARRASIVLMALSFTWAIFDIALGAKLFAFWGHTFFAVIVAIFSLLYLVYLVSPGVSRAFSVRGMSLRTADPHLKEGS